MLRIGFRSLIKINRFSFAYKVREAEQLRYQNGKVGESQANFYPSLSDNLPQQNQDVTFLEKSEIENRILKILRNFPKVDLKKVDFNQSFLDQQIDSLDQVSLLTSIEEEFNTVFEDRVFENFTNLNQVVNFLSEDHNIY